MSISPDNHHFNLDAAFGSIIRNWAQLESTLWMYLQALLLTPDQFRTRVIWASQPNWQSRRKLLLRLAETFLDESELPKFRAFMRRCNKLAHHRNLVAHSMFFMDGRSVVFFRDDDNSAPDDKSFNFMSLERFDVTNVLNWPRDISNLNREMIMYAAEHLYRAVHTSARMHREPPQSHAPSTDPHQAESTPEEPQRPPGSSEG